MKAPALLLAAVAITGCTNIPSAEELELQEQDQRWSPGYSAIPDAEPEPVGEPPPHTEPEVAPERVPGQPWIVVGRYDRRASGLDDLGERGSSALCPFETSAEGLPAVTVEGDLVVESVTETGSASDGEDESMLVSWHDVDGDSVEHGLAIYEGGLGWEEGRYHRHCRALWQQAKAQAELANRRLAQRTWRALQPMEIFTHDPDDYDYDLDRREEILATPARRRPAELTYDGRHAIVRIPGVKVLARTDVDWWGDDDDFCDRAPHVRERWADRETGAIVLSMDYQSGACLCDTVTFVHTLRWPESVFAAAERPVTSEEVDRDGTS